MKTVKYDFWNEKHEVVHIADIPLSKSRKYERFCEQQTDGFVSDPEKMREFFGPSVAKKLIGLNVQKVYACEIVILPLRKFKP